EVYLNRMLLSTWDRVERLILSEDGSTVAVAGKKDGHPAVGKFGAQPETYEFKAGEIFFVPATRYLVTTPSIGGSGALAIDGKVLRNIRGRFAGVSISPDCQTISFTAAGKSE